MDAGDWIALAAVVISVAAAGIAIWQAKTASASADHARAQARAADEQVRVAREQLQQAERVHREQLALAERVHREQNEPYVVVDIAPNEPGSGMLVLTIQNTGPTMARDVRVEFTPSLESSDSRLTQRLRRALSRPIAVLPPGRRLVYAVDTFQRWQVGLPMEFDVTVHANGPAGAVEPLTYRIDLEVLAESLVGERPNKRIEDALEKIAGGAKSLAGTYKLANGTAIRAERQWSQEQLRRLASEDN
ncbi:hypothetical protein ACFV7R_35040 [Streptomyces sp. NPDC059866]|uniref:hypothetical protein n=1 Tax=Streptomyces sp. NPDC059866 TaxID=3346978 RepID=UPI003647FC76